MKIDNLILKLSFLFLGILISCTKDMPSTKNPIATDNYTSVLTFVRLGSLTHEEEIDNKNHLKLVFNNTFYKDTCIVKLIDTSYSVCKTLSIATGTDSIIKISPRNIAFIEYYLKKKKTCVFYWYPGQDYSYIYSSLELDSLGSKSLSLTLSNTRLSYRSVNLIK